MVKPICGSALAMIVVCTSQLVAQEVPLSRALEAVKIMPMQLVYNVIVEGNPVAENAITVTRESRNGKEVIVAKTSTTGMVIGTNELIFEVSTFSPISSALDMSIAGQDMTLKLNYASARITGSSSVADQSVQINAPVPAGTLLGGMEEFAIMLTDLTRVKTITLPVFNSQVSMTQNFTAKVVRESKITVPAGTFDTFELDTTSADGNGKMFVTRTAPHIIVKQQVGDQLSRELLRKSGT